MGEVIFSVQFSGCIDRTFQGGETGATGIKVGCRATG